MFALGFWLLLKIAVDNIFSNSLGFQLNDRNRGNYSQSSGQDEQARGHNLQDFAGHLKSPGGRWQRFELRALLGSSLSSLFFAPKRSELSRQ